MRKGRLLKLKINYTSRGVVGIEGEQRADHEGRVALKKTTNDGILDTKKAWALGLVMEETEIPKAAGREHKCGTCG